MIRQSSRPVDGPISAACRSVARMRRVTPTPQRTDVLVVGAGPSGASAAAWAARAGRDVVLADAAVFPRDKTCGDGLTPRAIAELDLLGLGDWVRDHTVNRGLRAHGFGQTLLLPWPGGSLPDHGSAVPRTELDDRIRTEAVDVRRHRARGRQGRRRTASRVGGSRAVTFTPRGRDASRSSASGSSSPTACAPAWARCSVASGTRTPSTPWRAAATSTPRQSDDPWISSHLELRRRARRGAAGLRLDLPPRRRPGERRRRRARDDQAAGRHRDQAADEALHRRAPRRLRPHRRAADADERAAADGRRREQRRRRQLGAHRRRRRLRQPAQRRGHRLRPRDRPARRRPPRLRPRDDLARAAPATTTARRSPSPDDSPASSRCRGPSPRWGRSACAATG